jgi:hypothetical protein
VPINKSRVSKHLVDYNFKQLFIEELGWDNPLIDNLTIHEKENSYLLVNIAEKRNVQIFACEPMNDTEYPSSVERRKIEVKVRKFAHEHLIIFIDREKTVQRWQWVFRKPGQPAQYKEHLFENRQGTEALLQKLDSIEININDEENLRLLDVSLRLRDGFDKDKVTKKFYDNFKKQQKLFREFIEGIPGDHDQHWYSAVMLNRLMFIYFIQKKQFLNSDINYLKTKLSESREKFGDDNYYTFYRYFLRRLFHDGLDNKMPRGKELDLLFGKIPYLNGGIFSEHELEGKYPEINIKDEAFEKLFGFFDQYDWHLDDRPLENDKEINPDVLGYIFEKFINQKDMGAYYTKEDITEYISKNTIIPFLLNKAKEKCSIAFEGERSIWNLLRDDPDRYFYDSVKKGIKNQNLNQTNEIKDATFSQYPNVISEGLNIEAPDLLERRKDWNSKTPDEYALPNEIWRETISRWQRYFEVRQKLVNGEMNTINDLITYNLNIRQFAQDVIETWEGPELIRAFYKAITQIKVLDPTVGSGAFLFAALNILELLYEACIDRMQNFVDEIPAGANKSNFSDFKDILTQIEKHPNRKYFIYKSIIINNLYGVDIMEEAVEICKLRLFLKLVAQVETVNNIEPLPDIDFNIRSGNTLVGFATQEEVEKSVGGTLDFDNNAGKITDQAKKVQALYQVFLEAQMKENNNVADHKQELQKELYKLNDKLSNYLAGEYGIDTDNSISYDKWLTTHQPFHWFVEFYGILSKGGFDVVIGNPPYVRYRERNFDYRIHKNTYNTFISKNIYSFVYERSKILSREKSWLGLIIQISSVSTPSMDTMCKEICSNSKLVLLSHYATRPASLFEGVTMNLTIVISNNNRESMPTVKSTNYQRWNSELREDLFSTINYNEILIKNYFSFAIPKLSNSFENGILKKITKNTKTIGDYLATSNSEKNRLHYRTAGGRYFKIFVDKSFGTDSKSNKSKSIDGEYNLFNILAVLSSNTWWWWYTLHFDMYNCKDYMMFSFPYTYFQNNDIDELGRLLCKDLFNNAEVKIQSYASTGDRKQLLFIPSKSKPIIDEIDKILADHYKLTQEELDFIINYDIKYRMGKELNN